MGNICSFFFTKNIDSNQSLRVFTLCNRLCMIKKCVKLPVGTMAQNNVLGLGLV